jgi:hypothetical protein
MIKSASIFRATIFQNVYNYIHFNTYTPVASSLKGDVYHWVDGGLRYIVDLRSKSTGFAHLIRLYKKLRTIKLYAKARLDTVTSAMCYYEQWFDLDVQCSAYIFKFNKIFSIEHLLRAVHLMNSLPSQIPIR